MTEMLKVDPREVLASEVSKVAAVLEGGGTAALRTDTVYGLAARLSNPKAVERLYSAKGRPPEKKLPFLLADPERTTDFTSDAPPRARVLADAFWPGALTMVLGPDDKTVGVRVPDEDFLRAVLRAVGGPVAVTSANPSGSPDLLDAESVARAFDGKIDLIVDRGRALGGAPSSVVRLDPSGALGLLRKGPISIAALRAAAPRRVVVACTGNTCRSPMAAALLRRAAARRLDVDEAALIERGLDVRSAGVFASPGSEASPQARRAVSAFGADLSTHAATLFDADVATRADLVFAMTRAHLDRIERFGSGKRTVLFDPEGRDVPDPFGGSDDDYARCAARLSEIAESRAEALVAAESADGTP
jgi:L-threonylcarbamoyladenylate synthase